MTTKITKSGGIILKKENNQLYLLLNYREYLKDWTFPKGHIDEGEAIEQTAIREIQEETGLTIEIIKRLADHDYLHGKEKYKIKCAMFLTKPIGGDLKLEYPGDRLEWIPLNEVREKLTYPNLHEYFDLIIDDLRQYEN